MMLPWFTWGSGGAVEEPPGGGDEGGAPWVHPYQAGNRPAHRVKVRKVKAEPHPNGDWRDDEE